jgi:hypothetical protein
VDPPDRSLSGRYVPCLHLTWPGDWDRTLHRCYTDHVLAFFKILSGIHLEIGGQIYRTLMSFDFRKLCFEWHWKSPFPTDAEMGLLMHNVRNFIWCINFHLHMPQLGLMSKLHRPRFFWRWRASMKKSTSRYYIIGKGEKRARVVVEEIKGVWFEPYSRQVLKAGRSNYTRYVTLSNKATSLMRLPQYQNSLRSS